MFSPTRPQGTGVASSHLVRKVRKTDWSLVVERLPLDQHFLTSDLAHFAHPRLEEILSRRGENPVATKAHKNDDMGVAQN